MLYIYMPDNKYYFKTNIQQYDAPFKKFASTESMLGNLFVSIYDIPQTPFKPDDYSGNGQIDIGEFNDTKEEYDKKIAKIKQYCKKYGCDISGVKLPSYDDFSYLCARTVDAETIEAFLKPKKSLDEEIGLGNLPYTTDEKSEDYEKRTYADGTVVEIEFSWGKTKDLVIKNNKREVQKTFDITGFVNYESAIDEEQNIREVKRYFRGKLTHYAKFSYPDDKHLESRSFDEYGNPILTDDEKIVKQLANNLMKDLTNKNFLGITSVRDTLAKNLKQITPENIVAVCKEYKEATGKILIDDIKDASLSINKLTDYFQKDETTAEKIVEELQNKYIEAYKDKKIDDMQAFLANTGIGKYLDFEIDYYDDASDLYWDDYRNWKELTGRESFEGDFLYSNLPASQKTAITRAIEDVAADYRKNFKWDKKEAKNQKINNPYYKSENVYNVKYNGFKSVEINNLTTGKKRILDLDKLTKDMSPFDKTAFISTIQTYPAEVLEDMAVELVSVTGHSGKEAELAEGNADGIYLLDIRPTIFNSYRRETNVHETGHAVDFTYLSGSNNPTSTQGKFNETYNKELEVYIAKGHKKCTSTKDVTHSKEEGSNYSTCNEVEMFAECYTLLMTGDCISKKTILKYFSKTLEEAKKMLKEIRNLPDEVRLRR